MTDADHAANRINRALARIHAFGPDDEARLLDLEEELEGIANVPGSERLIEPLFCLMERCSHADLGSPGPVVHALETLRGYEPALLESLGRLPTVYSLWMLNRLINVASGRRRDDLLATLKRVAEWRDASPGVQHLSKHLLAVQLARSP